MRERLDRFKTDVKNHITKHRTKYLVSGGVVVGVVVGGVVVYFKLSKNHADQLAVISASSNVFGDVADSTITIDQSVITIIDRSLGDSGDVIKNLRTGDVYRSRGELSRATGFSMKAIGKYFKDELSDLGGDQYKIIDKADRLTQETLA